MENLVEIGSTCLSDANEADCRHVEPKQLEIKPAKDADLVLSTSRAVNIYGFENGKLGHESRVLLSAPCLRGLTDRKLTNCILFSNKLTGTMLGEAEVTGPKPARRNDLAGVEGMKCNGQAGDGEAEKEEPATVHAPSEPTVGTEAASGCCSALRANRTVSFLVAPRFLLLSVSVCFMAYGCSAPVVHLVPYALSLGLEHRQAAFLMAVFGASGIAGNITFGWIMDRK